MLIVPMYLRPQRAAGRGPFFLGRYWVRGAQWTGLAGLLVLASCKGIPTPAEKEARQLAERTAASYRPNGEKPALPVLTVESTLSNLLAYAMLNQPKVEAAYYDWMASIERITTARSLPDPQLTFQMDIADVVTSIMPGLMMNFPGPGKLRAGAEVASDESEARYFTFRSSVLESAFEVKRAYYQLYFLEEKIRVNRQTQSLLSDLEKLARAQNEVGKVTLQDVLRAQIEADRLTTEIENLQDSRELLQAQFRAALGLRSADPIPPLPRQFESTPMDLTSEKLFEAVLAANTRLKGMEAELRAAEAGVRLAHKARVPDSSLGLMADAKMEPVFYRPLATVSLPIWRDKLSAQLAEAQANKQSAAARLSAEQIALAVAFAERTFFYREANRVAELLQGQLLPKARQSLELARTGYLGGQIDFFNLMDTERTLLGFQLDAVEAATQRELALAEISLLVQGMPPSGPGMTTASPGPARSGRGSSKRSGSGGMNTMR